MDCIIFLEKNPKKLVEIINKNKTLIIEIPLYEDIEKETLKLFRSSKKNQKREITNYETITNEKKDNNH